MERAAEVAAQALGGEDLEVDLGALLGAAAHGADVADDVAGLDALVDVHDLAGLERGADRDRPVRHRLQPGDGVGFGTIPATAARCGRCSE